MLIFTEHLKILFFWVTISTVVFFPLESHTSEAEADLKFTSVISVSATYSCLSFILPLCWWDQRALLAGLPLSSLLLAKTDSVFLLFLLLLLAESLI